MGKSIITIIKDLCEENNISIGDLERSLNFSQGLISRWDKNSPSIDKILSVSDYFQVSTDYLLGNLEIKQTTKLEECFIDKLILETKNYSLNWQEYSKQFINKKRLQEIYTDLYYIVGDDKILGDIEYAYELEYNSSCIYLICAEYDYKLSVFLILQIYSLSDTSKDNFVPISTYQDFEKTKALDYEVSLYLKTNKVRDKSRIIMRNFINNISSPLPDEPIPYSHIINNCLCNMPGFVLDARVGKYLFDEIRKIWAEIGSEKKL